MTGAANVYNAVEGTIIMLLIMGLFILKQSIYNTNVCLCYEMLIFVFLSFIYVW